MSKSRNFSRSKGVRQERNLVNELKEFGLDARRIPGSGAFAYRVGDSNLKGDISVTYEGEEIKIECKVRAKEFNKIYELYDLFESEKFDSNVFLLIATLKSSKVAFISQSLTKLLEGGGARGFLSPPKGFAKTYSKIGNMQKYLGADCEILAIKADRKPWLFIRYAEEGLNGGKD